MVARTLSVLACVTALLAALPTLAAQPSLDGYFGAYVGRAVDEVTEASAPEERDIDIVIAPYKKDGFRIEWTNVSLVDSRRDVPGVKRRVSAVIFVPAKDRDLFVEAEEFNPFKERDEAQPMQGEAVRWAALDERGLHVVVFVLLEDGRYELQEYTRSLTEIGLDLTYERIVDGEVVRRMTGRTVRAD
jgi:hypothetical protein